MGKRVQVFDCEGGYFTRREAEVLLCCAQGLTNGQTADKLFISRKTVERHRENLRERFGLCGPHKLFCWAIKMEPKIEKWVNLPIDKQKIAADI
ncbi:helix-turn-helix transcriptional regulator [Persicitalea sp.]|uniref:helix-turn-helix domain-containing protein n=1 Tax=Persicitalea sp. TaxID=3100273 RepID=UPI003592F5C2